MNRERVICNWDVFSRYSRAAVQCVPIFIILQLPCITIRIYRIYLNYSLVLIRFMCVYPWLPSAAAIQHEHNVYKYTDSLNRNSVNHDFEWINRKTFPGQKCSTQLDWMALNGVERQIWKQHLIGLVFFQICRWPIYIFLIPVSPCVLNCWMNWW